MIVCRCWEINLKPPQYAALQKGTFYFAQGTDQYLVGDVIRFNNQPSDKLYGKPDPIAFLYRRIVQTEEHALDINRDNHIRSQILGLSPPVVPIPKPDRLLLPFEVMELDTLMKIRHLINPLKANETDQDWLHRTILRNHPDFVQSVWDEQDNLLETYEHEIEQEVQKIASWLKEIVGYSRDPYRKDYIWITLPGDVQ